MKQYFRLLSYLRPYRVRLGFTVSCIVMFVLLDGASMALVIPLQNVLFGVEEEVISLDAGEGEISRGFFGSNKHLVSLLEWIQSGDSLHALNRIVLLIVILFLFKCLFDYLQRYLSRSLEQLVVRDLRNSLHEHLSDLSFNFFHKTKTGQLISCMSYDISVIRAVLTDSFSKILMSGCLLLVYVGMLFATSWRLTLMAFVVIPPMAILVGWVARKLRRKNQWLQNWLGEITSIFQETISGIRVVKAFSMEDFERRKFQDSTQEYYRQYMRTNRYASASSPLTESLMTMVGAGFLLYGGGQVLSADLPAGDFIFFLIIGMRVMSPVKVFGNFNDVLQQGLSACDRIFGILDTKPAITDRPGAKELTVFERAIRYENVCFSYNPGQPVLLEINLEIRKGEALAIVGPSGAGKSTLVDLIPRFYDVDSGAITVDGTDIRDCRVASLRQMIGIVTQEVILFNDTVRNNIAYGLEDMPHQRVVEAARCANAHEFIEGLDNGYDTVIGERGARLSGGQRQRISIARAILKNPEILIFDEATSSLDTESEQLVQQAIERLMESRTSLVIAHRLSTIQHCDRIIVIDQGRIVESGTHEELLRAGKLYRRLYELQFQTTGLAGKT